MTDVKIKMSSERRKLVDDTMRSKMVVYTHIHTHTHTYTHTYTRTHTYIHRNTHTHTYTNTHIYTYTHILNEADMSHMSPT